MRPASSTFAAVYVSFFAPVEPWSIRHRIQDRRSFAFHTCSGFAAGLFLPSQSAVAYERTTDQFSYKFQPPRGFPEAPNQKPLKTHLDEVSFSNENGVVFGITVDPLRINRLSDFGTPEEVAAKVVLAEVNRDGVFDVTLMEDPIEGPDHKFYQLNYKSSGKRGDKRFVAKFYIENRKLFALTAQCKEENYATEKQAILNAVGSFEVL